MLRDRIQAGELLAETILRRGLRVDLVVGVPRGGVVVAGSLAQRLGAELNVALVAKLRAPQNPELAIGAVDERGEAVDITGGDGRIPMAYWEGEKARAQALLAARARSYREVRPYTSAAGRNVVLVDDGIATGATLLAAAAALRAQKPQHLVAAVPVAPPQSLSALRAWVDDCVVVELAPHLRAISQYYRDFPQVDDAAVMALLRQG